MNSADDKPRKALGKGLSALLPGRGQPASSAATAPAHAPATTPAAKPGTLPLGLIQPNPMQPRTSFNSDGLEELAELPAGDVVAELFALDDRVAEVEAEPDAGVDHLRLDVVHGVEVLCRRQDGTAVLATRHRDVDVMRVQHRRERVAERGGETAVLRRVLGMPRHG